MNPDPDRLEIRRVVFDLRRPARSMYSRLREDSRFSVHFVPYRHGESGAGYYRVRAARAEVRRPNRRLTHRRSASPNGVRRAEVRGKSSEKLKVEVEVAVGALFGIMAKGAWASLNGREMHALWIKIRPASVRVRGDEMTGQKTWRQAPGSESSQIASPPQGVAARNDRRAGRSSRAKQMVFLSPTDQWITSQAETAPVFASAA